MSTGDLVSEAAVAMSDSGWWMRLDIGTGIIVTVLIVAAFFAGRVWQWTKDARQVMRSLRRQDPPQ